jgi:hypothetical protein
MPHGMLIGLRMRWKYDGRWPERAGMMQQGEMIGDEVTSLCGEM